VESLLDKSFCSKNSLFQGELVKPENFVLNSEYLTTLLVVIPLANLNDWHAKYETLTEMIVPR
jgi:V-type H+-transporting ATPase subunit C